jgi:hypothetical protein
MQQSTHKAVRWTLLSWDTRRIMVIVLCIILFMAYISLDFIFELSPSHPLPFTFQFFTTQFNIFVGSHLLTNVSWRAYHIEYYFGAYAIPPPILNTQEYSSLSVGRK